MKYPGYPQIPAMNGELPPCMGFTLLQSATLRRQAPRALDSSFRQPQPPQRTPEERRQHLIRVLESAMAILDADDDDNMGLIGTPADPIQPRPSQRHSSSPPQPPKN